MFITDSVKYIGADDKDIDLFESQYVVPEGVSYNSYFIMDDKITVMMQGQLMNGLQTLKKHFQANHLIILWFHTLSQTMLLISRKLQKCILI